jgi:hypothetical protein
MTFRRNSTASQQPGVLGCRDATTALAIGANTAMFSFVNGMFCVLCRIEPDRIVRVLEKVPGGGPMASPP